MFDKNRYYIYDGAMGTMLQPHLEPGQIPDLLVMTNPQAVADVHQAYVDAGSQIICTNTFGANGHNLSKTDYSVDSVVTKAVTIAKSVAKDQALVSLDIGPLGVLMAPMGPMTFDRAYELFQEMAIYGEKAGADCVTIETMTDLKELRAAILAVKENTSLPILATMTFQENGHTYFGTTAESFAMVAQGLGVTALGINCSLGPKQLKNTMEKIASATSLPLILKPNAGLPDPETGEYSLKPSDFTEEILPLLPLGVQVVGGCCGTAPAFIQVLAEQLVDQSPQFPKELPKPMVCTANQVVELDENVLLGTALLVDKQAEFRQALQAGNTMAVLSLVQADVQDGATVICYPVLDGFLDEHLAMVQFLQEYMGKPLVFYAKSANLLGAVLRHYTGKACVLLDEEADMEAFSEPIVKYGAILMGENPDSNEV